MQLQFPALSAICYTTLCALYVFQNYSLLFQMSVLKKEKVQCHDHGVFHDALQLVTQFVTYSIY